MKLVRHPFAATVIAGALLATGFAAPAWAQEKIHLNKAADLPRFSYPVSGSVESLVQDQATYEIFAKQRRADLQSIFDKYQIDDNSTLRGLVGEAAGIDFLLGNYDLASAEIQKVQALQDKPSAKLMSGLDFKSFIAAAQATGSTSSDAFHQQVVDGVANALKPLPFKVVESEVKESESRKETLGSGLILGRIRDVLQPSVDKNKALSGEQAGSITGARFTLQIALPVTKPLAGVYQAYIDANTVVKADIWAARDIALPADAGYKNVNVGIWDSGVDIGVYAGNEKAPVIAYDLMSNRTTGHLFPLVGDAKDNLATEKSYLQGLSDLRSNIQSPEAAKVKQLLSTLTPEQYKSTIETLSEVGDYSHGTHVAGISIAGNPYARLVVGRITFDWKLIPDPCPSRALTEKNVQADVAYVNFFKSHHVRVVNMSWGGDVKGYEHSLEQCGMGKNPDERKAMARQFFDIERDGLTRAIASAPGILFVAAAGNSDQDAAFVEDIPGGIRLPNLIAVGAVDQAGDEAPFTSYGPTVTVDANGYQVKSHIPGGETIALSGTSMAAPQVTNLAAKLFAVDPRLTPVEAIKLIQSTGTKSDDGRRNLINPAVAVDQLKSSSVPH